MKLTPRIKLILVLFGCGFLSVGTAIFIYDFVTAYPYSYLAHLVDFFGKMKKGVSFSASQVSINQKGAFFLSFFTFTFLAFALWAYPKIKLYDFKNFIKSQRWLNAAILAIILALLLWYCTPVGR